MPTTTNLPCQNTSSMYRRLLSIAILLLSLSNCGGGGGSNNVANIAPQASFSIIINPVTSSLTASFDGNSSSDSDGSISSYQWDFGDGNTGSGVSISHPYNTAGSYTITLTVTDNSGDSDNSSQTIDLTEVTAVIILSRDSSIPGGIQFDGSGSTVTGPGNSLPTIVSYDWDFGDGNNTTGALASHSYTNLGDYSATLTVTDSSGASNSTSIATTFSLSGTINAAGSTAVDVDINDPSRQNRALLGSNFIDNDNSLTPQSLSNPVLLNGFISKEISGTPTSGNSNYENDIDVDDYYSAFLLAGQFVSLRVADFNPDNITQNDIDLAIYDNSGILIASSTEVDEVESVAVPSDGDYFIRVNAFAGISKYILNIGNNSFASGHKAYGNPANIIPGEAIVKLKPVSSMVKNSAFSQTNTLQGLSHQQRSRSALMHFTIDSKSTISAANNITALLNNKNYTIHQTLKTIKQLRLRDDVEYAEPNYRISAQRTPNDSFYPFQWHYPQINLPQAWDITTGSSTGTPVVVAVVDSGVLFNHEDLAGQLLNDGYDFIRDTETSQDGDGIDNNPSDPGDGIDGNPGSWHGTHVAGTIAAASDNSRGVAGISWGAKILPIRVLGQGGGSSYDVVQGVRYAAGLNNDSGTTPAQSADIINLSLGGGGFNQSTQNLFNQLQSAGIIVIAAAGNESSTIPDYPASYNNVISVSAVDPNNGLAPYSNFGTFIDVAAPGGDASQDRNGDGYNDGVLSTLFDEDTGSDSYAFYEGTSMATPHVSGVAALMKSLHPNLSADEFLSSLQNGNLTNDIGETGKDTLFGYGLIDALKAVQQAQILAGGNATGSLLTNPSSLNFGNITNSQNLQLTAVGNNPPTVNSVTETLDWLTIDVSNTDASGVGTYDFIVDRTGLADAIYSGNVIFDLDNGKELSISVSMRVQSAGSASADAGYLYLLLLDADSSEFVAQINQDVVDGQYQFQFNNIPFGEYIIFAGSDVDNDFFICGIGESCGSYPTNEQLLRIIVDSDKEGLDFLVSIVSDVIGGANTGSNTNNKITEFKRQFLVQPLEPVNNKKLGGE